MAVYFMDSSACVKRYVSETGTAWIESLMAPSSGHIRHVCRVTQVEVTAALARRQHDASVAPAAVDALISRARADLMGTCFNVEVTPALVSSAADLAKTHRLRGYDAIQLAAALVVNGHYLSQGAPPVTLVSADAELSSAGAAEGLPVEDPNLH